MKKLLQFRYYIFNRIQSPSVLKFKAFWLTLAFIVMIGVQGWSATITITTDTDWSEISPTPTSSDDIVVNENATLTVDVTNGVCNSITLNDGGKKKEGHLTFNLNSVATVSGDVTISGGNQPHLLDMTLGGKLVCTGLVVTDATVTFTPGIGTVELTGNNIIPVEFTTFNNLTLSGGTTTVSASNNLTVTGTVTTTATNSLVIESTASGSGSLIYATGTPAATVQRYVESGANHLVAPMTDASTANDFYISETHDSWLSYHTESDNGWDYITDISAPLSRGQGYSYWVDATAYTVEFTGALTAADQSYVLAYSGSGLTQGWNLLGNPFASALDWDLGTWGINSTGTVYVWDNTQGSSGDYVIWNGSTGGLTDGIIPMGQGFFVQSTSSGSFAIPEAARVHSLQSFYKSSNNSDPSQYVRIQLDGESFRNTVFVGFPENGTDGFDYKGDATKFYSSFETPQVFAVENENELCINANAPLTEAGKTVPLHLVQVVDGNYTLTTSDLNQLPDATITLEDLKTGVTQDLNENPIYSFNASNNDNPARFLLHFAYSPDGIGEDFEQSSNVQVYSYGKDIYIKSTDDAINQSGDVFVHDMMGRKIAHQKINKGELMKLTVSLNNSYAVVKVVKDGSVKTKKVFIK